MEIEDYIKRLQVGYDDRMNDESKLVFLGNDVFSFTTYDDNMTTGFAGLMLEVISCILNKTTFEYQDKSKEHYFNYILMCNMPFLKDKLEWGSSIRGAWFDYYKGDGYQVLGEYLPASDLEKFLRAVLKWVNT